jgi:hypothetical protein
MKLVREGRYDQTTFADPETSETPVISTIFYLDGDVQNRINEEEGVILADKHSDLVNNHLKKVMVNVSSMDVFLVQIQAISTLIIAAVTFIWAFDFNNLKDSLLLTTGAASVSLILRKNIARTILWILRLLLKTYLRAFTKEWTG